MKSGYRPKAFAALLASILLAALLVLPAVSGFVASPVLAQNGSGSGNTVTWQSSGNVTIQVDPAKLSSPGYVTVTIKLKNTNTTPGSENIIGIGEEGELEEQPSATPDGSKPTPDPTVTEAPTPTAEPTEAPTTAPKAGTYIDVTVTNAYSVTFETKNVAPGKVGVFKGQLMVKEEMFGTPLSFTVSWYDTLSETSCSETLSVTVQRNDTTYLRLVRTISETKAAMGDVIEITYTMINTGTRKLNNIKLVDEKIAGSNPMLTPFSLSSGETKEFVYEYTMQGASVMTKPTATFTPEGSSNALSVTVSGLTIGLINAQLSKTVTVGTPTPEGVTFTLFLTNNGSQNLTGLTVTDDLGNVIASGFSLAIGESKIIEHHIADPGSVRNVVFTITGSYANGKEFRDNTTSYTVRPYIDPSALGIRFSAEVIKPLDADNNIGLTFTVVNYGRVPYTDIVLTEKELSYPIHEISTLMPSDSGEVFDVFVNVGQPRELVFYLTAVDPSGNSYRYEAYVTAEYIDLQSTIPNVTPEPGAESPISILDIDVDKQISEKGQELMNWWRKLEIIFFAALGLIIILVIVEFALFLSSRRRKKKNN